MSDTNLDLIAALLRKAEGTDNEHEAEAFMTRAQTLATRNSIDLAVARAHTARKEAREEVEEQVVTIGQRGKQGLSLYVNLFLAVARANDIQCLIASNSTRVFAIGFPSDIEVAQAIYSSLLVQMVQAGDAYVKSGAYKGQTTQRKVRVEDAWGYSYTTWQTRPVDARIARRSFYDGFTQRVGLRLLEAKMEAVEAAESEDVLQQATETNPQALTTTALVLREKKAEVDVFYAKRSKGAGTYKGGRNNTGSSSHARKAGDAAGSSARLAGQHSLPAGRSRISA